MDGPLAIVVKDTPEESALLLLPGAACAYPQSYFQEKAGDLPPGTLWPEITRRAWSLQSSTWRTNRVLMLIEPDKYYSIWFFWEFTLPARLWTTTSISNYRARERPGVLIRSTSTSIWLSRRTWPAHWKDEEGYQALIRAGFIDPAWAAAVEQARAEVLARLARRQYPWDGSWLVWRPEPAWRPSPLPEWLKAP